jgi:hypothetical protein
MDLGFVAPLVVCVCDLPHSLTHSLTHSTAGILVVSLNAVRYESLNRMSAPISMFNLVRTHQSRFTDSGPLSTFHCRGPA